MAARLLSSRERAGLSQYALAEAASVPRPTVKRLERHEVRTVPVDVLKRLEACVGRLGASAEKTPGGALVRGLKKRPYKKGSPMVRVTISAVRDCTVDELFGIRIIRGGKRVPWQIEGHVAGVECTVVQSREGVRKGSELDLVLMEEQP